MSDRTWESIELPVLRAIVALEAEAPVIRHSSVLIDETGIERKPLILALRALLDDGYIAAQGMHAAYPPGFDYAAIRALPKARRAIGQWPPEDAYDALLAGLEARLRATTDTETRSRLERFRDGLLALGREVAGELIADVLRRGV